MAPRKRNTAERERDRTRAVEAWLQGHSQEEIAAMLGVSRQQVGYDLAAARAEWVEAARADRETLRAEVLARLERLYREAWVAWHDSRGEKQTTTTEKVQDKGAESIRVRLRREQSCGDVTFLREARECESAIVTLLGLAGPVRHEFTGREGGPLEVKTTQQRTPEQVAADVDRLAGVLAVLEDCGAIPRIDADALARTADDKED